MGDHILQPGGSGPWALVQRQHGVITREQLLGLGFTPKAVHHRIATGRLHRVRQGVYAVGRPELTRHGYWMAAVLSCGPDALLSHESAAELWRIHVPRRGRVEVSVPAHRSRRPAGIVVHRRAVIDSDERSRSHGIPVTSWICTLVDIAARVDRAQLEAAVNEADRRDLVDPEALRSAIDTMARRPGTRVLRRLLDQRTFTLTDSELERRFLSLTRPAGLSRPVTGTYLNGFKVDFYWPELGLVVETDGLRYHRTPAQQARDRERDQAHAAAGLTPLRFTHAQVRFDAGHVRGTLVAVAERLARGAGGS